MESVSHSGQNYKDSFIMLDRSNLLEIKKWFDNYVQQFYTGNECFDSAICLKIQHTNNVVVEILDIVNSLNAKAEDCALAEIVAVLHDIGRFEQYAKYHTYSDLKSEDHAALGIEVIKKTGVLNKLEPYDREPIETAIAHHNRAFLPKTIDTRALFFLKLLRDADKIDILRIVTEHYSGVHTNGAVNNGLPENPEVSESILQSIIHGELIKFNELKTVNDFKLLQISWVFDLNFKRTFEIISARNYFDRIAASLPQTDAVLQALSVVKQHLSQKC
jgi:hypothetical protein